MTKASIIYSSLNFLDNSHRKANNNNLQFHKNCLSSRIRIKIVMPIQLILNNLKIHLATIDL